MENQEVTKSYNGFSPCDGCQFDHGDFQPECASCPRPDGPVKGSVEFVIPCLNMEDFFIPDGKCLAYRVSNPSEEYSCEWCGWPVYVGDTAYQTNTGFYCCKTCASQSRDAQPGSLERSR